MHAVKEVMGPWSVLTGILFSWIFVDLYKCGRKCIHSVAVICSMHVLVEVKSLEVTATSFFVD